MKGIYLLEISFQESQILDIGSLGEVEFSGDYVYVGSALGPGGFQRVKRHLQVASRSREGGHWHIDNLLVHGKLVRIWLIPTSAAQECRLAAENSVRATDSVEGFGCTDCDCSSHLFQYDGTRSKPMLEAIRSLRIEGSPVCFEPPPDI